jgi:hypothetical protein
MLCWTIVSPAGGRQRKIDYAGSAIRFVVNVGQEHYMQLKLQVHRKGSWLTYILLIVWYNVKCVIRSAAIIMELIDLRRFVSQHVRREYSMESFDTSKSSKWTGDQNKTYVR